MALNRVVHLGRFEEVGLKYFLGTSDPRCLPIFFRLLQVFLANDIVRGLFSRTDLLLLIVRLDAHRRHDHASICYLVSTPLDYLTSLFNEDFFDFFVSLADVVFLGLYVVRVLRAPLFAA